MADDDLPPTQYLVLEVLAARYRLGEPYWTFPNRVRPAVAGLIDAGLVWTHSGPVEASFQVRFTDDGLKEALGADYVTPIAAAESRGRTAGYAEAVQALRNDHEFWTFMEGHRHGEDMVEVANNPNGIAAEYLESVAASTPSATTEEPSRG